MSKQENIIDLTSFLESGFAQEVGIAAVQAQQSVLPVLVHPFYSFFPRPKTLEADTQIVVEALTQDLRQFQHLVQRVPAEQVDPHLSSLSLTGYLLRLKQFLATTPKDLIFLTEYAGHLPYTLYLLQLIGYSQKILVLPTEVDTPQPAEPNSWENVAEALEILGPQTILLIGQLNHVHPHSYGQVNGCLPGFAYQLEGEFAQRYRPWDYVVSPISYPQWHPQELSHLNSNFKRTGQHKTR